MFLTLSLFFFYKNKKEIKKNLWLIYMLIVENLENREKDKEK